MRNVVFEGGVTSANLSKEKVAKFTDMVCASQSSNWIGVDRLAWCQGKGNSAISKALQS
jgi:hypothetical protein